MAQNSSFPWVPSQSAPEPEDRNESPQRKRLRAVFLAFQESGAGANLALDILLHELAEEVLFIPNVCGSAIALRVAGSHFVCRAVAGEPTPAMGARIEAQDGISAECIRTGRLQVCQETEADARVNAEMCRAWGVRSLVIVPLFLRQRLIGILEAFSPIPGGFDRYSVERLTSLGHSVVETVAFSETPVPFQEVVSQRPAAPLGRRVETWTETPLPESETVREVALESAARVSPPSASESMPIPVPPMRGTPTWTFTPVAATTPGPRRRNLGLALVALAVGVLAVVGLWNVPFSARSVPGTAIAREVAPAEENASSPSSSSSSTAQTVAPRPAKPSPSAKLQVSSAAKNDGAGQHSGELVVYEKGKVVYRALPGSGSMIGPATGTAATGTATAGTAATGSPTIASATAGSATEPGPMHQPTRINPVKMIPSSSPAPGPVTPASETEKLRDTVDAATISGGKLIHQVDPVMPPEVAGLHLPEEVLLEGIVDRNGTVRDIRFLRGDMRLSAAAIDAVRQWRYEPFRANGEVVDMLSTLSVRFR